MSLACGAFGFVKKSGMRCILPLKTCSLIIMWCIWFEVSHFVYSIIGGGNDSNSNTQWSQQNYLYLTAMKKVSNNKHFVKSNLLRYEWHNANSIPKQSIKETTYVSTLNITITISILVSILLHFHTISSRLLLNSWHSNDPEPKTILSC